MPDEIPASRIEALAAAARVPLRDGAAARIALAVSYPTQRFAAENVALPLEAEPFTYLVAAGKELRR